MSEIIKLLIPEGMGGLIFSCLLFVFGLWIDKLSIKSHLSTTRVISRISLALVIILISVCCRNYYLFAIIFSLQLLLTIWYPNLIEILILAKKRKEHKCFFPNKPSVWLWTTPALIRYYHDEIKNAPDIYTRQRIEVKLIDIVKSYGLFDREYVSFYLPLLHVYCQIGANKKLEDELKKLKRFDTNKDYTFLRIFLLYTASKYEEMKELLDKELSKEDLPKETWIIDLLNKMCADESSGEKEYLKIYVEKMEIFLEQNKFSNLTLCHDLMTYYDANGLKDKGDKLANDIEKYKSDDFKQYVDFMDVAFMHYRRIHNVHKVHEMLKNMFETNDKLQHGEEQMISKVRFANICFEQDFHWQEYSTKLFIDHNKYLDYSWRVGVEFIKSTVRICLDAQNVYGKVLNGTNVELMFKDMRTHVGAYLNAIENEIVQVPVEFVYRRIQLLMDKVSLYNFMLSEDAFHYQENKTETYDRILTYCENNGLTKEKIHYLTVYVDDLITVHKQFSSSIKNTGFKNVNKYLNNWDTYKSQASNMLHELTTMLKSRKYNRPLAYYVLYAAYFYHELGDQINAKFFYNQFEKYKVSIMNFTKPIQLLYFSLKENYDK